MKEVAEHREDVVCKTSQRKWIESTQEDGQMKVYLYSQWKKMIEKSGVGRAAYHQQKALENQNVQLVSKKEEADVIHINTIFPGSLRMALWAKRHHKAVVFHAHSTREDFENSYIGSNLFAGFFQKWITLCYSQGDCIITPSRYSAGLLRSYGIQKPVHVLSNGIDTEFYFRRAEDWEAFREEYGYSKEDKIVMSVGLWIKRKGILDFAALAESMPQYQFIWFGQSDLNTVPADIREAVKKKLPNLKFAGYVNRDKLRQAYGACDLFLFPSYEETEGIVVLEALSMKIPVLLRDIPVYSDWLEHGKTVYKAENQEEFKELTEKILQGDVENLTEKGYEIAQKRNISSIGACLADIYDQAQRIQMEKKKHMVLYRPQVQTCERRHLCKQSKSFSGGSL